jgi:hypothetical protein
MVGEKGPEWMQGANDNSWSLVGAGGPELLNQGGGATILPFPVMPPGRSFASGTGGGSDDTAAALAEAKKALIAELQALRKQVMGGQVAASADAKAGNSHLADISRNVGPNISAPVRRAV